jgi:hypothetical protein
VIGRNIRGGCPFRRRAILCDEEEDPVYCTMPGKYYERTDVQKLFLTPIFGSVRRSQYCELNLPEGANKRIGGFGGG